MAHVQRIAAIEPLTKFTQDAYTLTKDLTVDVPITEIIVGFQGTNGGTSNDNMNIARNITKIEIVDGSEVLWALSGPLAVAHAAYQTGQMCYRYDREDPDVSSRIRIPIRFGNFIGDEEKAFYPPAFTNPQIKVTYNQAAVNPVGATGILTATTYLAIYARLMEDAPAPTSWIMAKEIESWVTGATGYKFVDLPVDYPYRHLLVRAYKTAVGAPSNFNEVKLSKNVDAFVFFDIETAELLRQLEHQYPTFLVNRRLYALHGDARDTYFGWNTFVNLQPITGNIQAWHTNPGVSSLALQVYVADAGTTQDSNVPIDCQVRGHTPENTFPIHIAMPTNPDDWVTFLSTDSVRVRFKEGSAGAAATLAAVQLRRY